MHGIDRPLVAESRPAQKTTSSRSFAGQACVSLALSNIAAGTRNFTQWPFAISVRLRGTPFREGFPREIVDVRVSHGWLTRPGSRLESGKPCDSPSLHWRRT